MSALHVIRIPTAEQLAHWRWLVDVDQRLVARFLAKCLEEMAPADLAPGAGPCSLWTGAWSKGGNPEHRLPYGSFRVNAKAVVRAHIFSALVLGTWSGVQHVPGYHVDHRCKRTLCVAPLHLEPVPGAVNQARRWAGWV